MSLWIRPTAKRLSCGRSPGPGSSTSQGGNRNIDAPSFGGTPARCHRFLAGSAQARGTSVGDTVKPKAYWC
eukprot:14834535-Alexandrium_andersonii.AAC.1